MEKYSQTPCDTEERQVSPERFAKIFFEIFWTFVFSFLIHSSFFFSVPFAFLAFKFFSESAKKQMCEKIWANDRFGRKHKPERMRWREHFYRVHLLLMAKNRIDLLAECCVWHFHSHTVFTISGFSYSELMISYHLKFGKTIFPQYSFSF